MKFFFFINFLSLPEIIFMHRIPEIRGHHFFYSQSSPLRHLELFALIKLLIEKRFLTFAFFRHTFFIVSNLLLSLSIYFILDLFCLPFIFPFISEFANWFLNLGFATYSSSSLMRHICFPFITVVFRCFSATSSSLFFFL